MSISTANANIATFNRYLFNATGGETSLSGVDANGNTLAYTVGKEQVYLNGVMLVRGTDYVATTGTSITGLTALAASDVVEILAYGTFVVATASGAAQTTPPTAPVEGVIWLDTDGIAPQFQQVRWSKSPSAGTTVLSGTDDGSTTLSYTAGYEYVYLNGTLLSRGNDYTASNGSSITLTTATVAGDVVEVVSNNNITTVGTGILPSAYPTIGDMLYASAANTPARLGIGSTNQILTVSGGVPTWTTPTAGVWTQLATGSLSGATVTVSGLSGKRIYAFIVDGSNSSNTTNINIRLNGDTGNNYYATDSGAGSALRIGYFATTGNTFYRVGCIIEGADSAIQSKAVVVPGGDITDGGFYNSTSAITSLSFYLTAGAFDNGTYYIWSSN